MKVRILKEIWRRLASHDGHSKALAQFVKCCQNDEIPPRIYKPSGIARDGSRFEPYLRLRRHHHHLGRNGDPLLVTQHIEADPPEIVSVALATHANHLSGDRWLWLQVHMERIDWTSCEDLRREAEMYAPR